MKKGPPLFPGVVLLCGSLVLFCCGDPPPTTPDPYTGILRVAALDTLIIDSIRIELDDVMLGRFRNPHVLREVVIGIHRVLVSSTSSGAASRVVEVFRDRQTDLFVPLLAGGPYVGNVAPLFTARASNGDTVSIQRERGKAVFLIFFEHT